MDGTLAEFINYYGGLAMLAFCLYLGWMVMKQYSEKKNVYEFKLQIKPAQSVFLFDHQQYTTTNTEIVHFCNI